MRHHGTVSAFWSALKALAPRGIAAAISLAVGCVPAAVGVAQAASSYLAVWASDKETDDRPGVLDTDFLAIIDADPKSRTYGKVVNTASLQSRPGTNLLNDLGLTNA